MAIKIGDVQVGSLKVNGVDLARVYANGVLVYNNAGKLFSMTGSSQLLNDDDTPYTPGNDNWKIKSLASGVFVPSEDMDVDIFLVGGGGGGSADAFGGHSAGGSGGNGGEQRTVSAVHLTKGTAYTITIGNGGIPGAKGGTTSMVGGGVNASAPGGNPGIIWNPDVYGWGVDEGWQPDQGNGSGRGGRGFHTNPGTGEQFGWATDGKNGGREFGTNAYYSGGGGGRTDWDSHVSAYGQRSGAANTGGGGNFCQAGFSGAVVIRNKR